eukprot:2940546-Pyramimonas_sp.AAC.1
MPEKHVLATPEGVRGRRVESRQRSPLHELDGMEDAPPGASVPERAGGPRQLEFSRRPASSAEPGALAEPPGEDDLDDDEEVEEPVIMKSIRK